jgi:hypothetical protein
MKSVHVLVKKDVENKTQDERDENRKNLDSYTKLLMLKNR